MKSHHIEIEGEYYSPKHPKALKLQRPIQSDEEDERGFRKPWSCGLEIVAHPNKPDPKRIRQRTKPLLNKLETEYLP